MNLKLGYLLWRFRHNYFGDGRRSVLRAELSRLRDANQLLLTEVDRLRARVYLAAAEPGSAKDLSEQEKALARAGYPELLTLSKI
jgi:hypothetical protein